MSEEIMAKTEELENVRTAYFLEETISNLKHETDNLFARQPIKPTNPDKPVLRSAKAQLLPYPNIESPQIERPKKWRQGIIIFVIGCIVSMMFFSSSMSLLPMIGFGLEVFGMIYVLRQFIEAGKEKKKMEQQYIQRVKESPEYQNECRKIDEENRLIQTRLDEQMKQEYSQKLEEYVQKMQKYNEKMELYEKELLPQWKEEKEALKTAKTEVQNALNMVYSKNIIPVQHRNLPAVLYLATFMGTSQYDLRYAIERYDSYVMQCAQREQINLAKAQLAVMHETLANQQYANYLHEQMVDLTENSNKVLNSIRSWQRADFALREYRRIKMLNAAKKVAKE